MSDAVEILKKTPDEDRLFDFDFFNALASEAEALTGAPTITITPAGINILSVVTSATKVQMLLRGGAIDTDYNVNVKVDTTLSQKLESCGVLQVRAC